MKTIAAALGLLIGAGTLLASQTSSGLKGISLIARGSPQWVAPALETPPMPSAGDAADDPAIWVDALNPSRSLVIATDKKSGLLSYTLDGRQHQYLDVGRLNNVDLRSGAWGQPEATLVAASQGKPGMIALFSLDPVSRRLRLEARLPTRVVTPYGLCMALAGDGTPWVILNGKDGTFVQYAVSADFTLTEVRSWHTRTKPEGCAADDASGWLYVGEEAHGVWRLPIDPGAETQLHEFATIADGWLREDIEGMDVYRTAASAYLVVSSQGSDSFTVFDTATGDAMERFRVGRHPTLDDVSGTDGLAVTSTALPGFPAGLLVVQDGDNGRDNQNFKLVSWQEIDNLLAPAG